MPPKMRFGNKGKGTASSTLQRPPTYPWPRPENTPFDLAADELPHSSPTAWDETDAFHYNRLLHLQIEPTRFMCEPTLIQLGLQDQVRSILCHARCMAFALEEDFLFPDVTRQCLATATLTYTNPDEPTFDEAFFSFFAGGTRYEISMRDFCITYGFRETDKRLEYQKKFSQSKTFWSLIASGEYSSNSASQNRLRHPAIRIVARILSNMLFARATGNKVHIDELLLLFLGCGPIMGGGNSEQYEGYRSNLGIRFAETICAIKDSPVAIHNGPRVERIGSLLTTLFRYLHVDLSRASSITELSRLDMQHLFHSKIILKPSTYQFIAATGEANFLELPNTELTQLHTMNDLAFQPPTERLDTYPCRTSSAARPSASRRSTSCDPRQAQEDASPSTPRLALTYHHASTTGEFDLPPISDDAEGAEYRRWMIQATKKNNSLMQRIMKTLSQGCCKATEARDAQRVPPDDTPQSGQPLRRKKRRTSRDEDDEASSR